MSTRIDELGLVDIVNELRGQYSYARIAKIINERYLPEGEEPISQMTVHRYLRKKNEIVPAKQEVVAVPESEEIDPYDEMKMLINIIDARLESIQESLTEVEKKKNKNVLKDDDKYRDLVSLQEKLIARKQNLLNNIAKYQSEIGTYTNMKEIIRILVETLKSIPGAYDSFRQKIDGNIDLKNLCR